MCPWNPGKISTYAQFSVANMYRYGHGVKQDAKEAFKWFKLAAEQGHTISQFNLAMLH